jgi:uncharacterized protein
MPARFWEARPGRIWIGRLETGDDLVEGIEQFAAEQSIRAAWVNAIGAVRRASFAYYDQDERRYVELASTEHHEMTGFIGNISTRDDRPFLHAHATFADDSGAAAGGHLLAGCEVFVAEITISEMTGAELIRTPDEVTGLALW